MISKYWRIEKRNLKWFVLGLSAVVVVIGFLWIGLTKEERERPEIGKTEPDDFASVFERKDIHAMDIDQLKAYIRACEGARDLKECERAYLRAIQLTQGEGSLSKEYVEFRFGLAEFYLNALWEYGQFGGAEKIPPAIERAIRIYDEIIASHPDSELAAEAQFRKGRIFHNELSGYWNALHTDDAIREFEKVIVHYPDTEQARRARDILSLLHTHRQPPSSENQNPLSPD